MAKRDVTTEAWLDRPGVLAVAFHPRTEPWGWLRKPTYEELAIPVEGGVTLGARLYGAGADRPTILFFHGNGEIVADYDDLARQYVKMGVNFIPVDYRGYGKSTGHPTVTAMLRDSHEVFDWVRKLMRERGYAGPLVVMGRSLGSACALELASARGPEVDKLVVESGFAYVLPLLIRLGADVSDARQEDMQALSQIDKISAYSGPTLIIHGELDQIIPFSEAQALFGASRDPGKKLVRIAGADHNSLLAVGFQEYMEAVRSFIFGAAH